MPVPTDLDTDDWSLLFDMMLEPQPVDERVTTAPVRRQEVVEVRYLSPGGRLDINQPHWIAVVRLRDDRWAYLSLAGSFTADPPPFWTFVSVASSLRQLWWGALGDDERDRFTSQMSQEDREAELVELDVLLEAGDPAAMRRIERLRGIR